MWRVHVPWNEKLEKSSTNYQVSSGFLLTFWVCLKAIWGLIRWFQGSILWELFGKPPFMWRDILRDTDPRNLTGMPNIILWSRYNAIETYLHWVRVYKYISITYHIISCHVMSYHIISYLVSHISCLRFHISSLRSPISYPIISYHTSHISYHITSHHITSHHITSHITSHHITSHHITSHHITSHHITSHHITSHHIISYHIISYLSLFFFEVYIVSFSSCLMTPKSPIWCVQWISRFPRLPGSQAWTAGGKGRWGDPGWREWKRLRCWPLMLDARNWHNQTEP